MTDNRSEIGELIHRWVAGVQSRDVDAVAAGHTGDIVMFDVPPPYRGVRGIEAYRESWPPFFDYLAQGAVFDLLELDIAVGDAPESSIAYAYALLRCGKPVELTAKPAVRLRITFGLRRDDGRWQIAHEHHSFPMED
jgi:uncharacterized protein (TIGR02246 family)